MAEKRYYWIKLKDTFLTSDAVDFLMSQKNGANYVVLYQMLCLKTVNTGGELSRQIGEVIIPFDIDKIHRDCKYFEKDTVVVALELYRKLGLVYENKNGFLQIANFDNLVGSETRQAELMREKRKRVNEIEQTANQNKTFYIDNYTNKKRYGGNYYYVLERDKNRCASCGSTETLCVHHIIGYDENEPKSCNASSMITLCRTCHSNEHNNPHSVVTNKLLDDISFDMELYSLISTINPNSRGNNVTRELQKSYSKVTQEKDIRYKRIDNRKYKESISKDIPKKESKSTFDDLISSYTSNSELHNSIIEFIKMRKLIKKPMTDKALNLLFSSLDKLSKSDTDKKAILEQSILNCWQGVFPLKTDKPAESTDINKAIDIINNRRNQAELLQSRFLADLRKNPSFAEAESRLDGLRFDKSKAECQGRDTTELERKMKEAEAEFAAVLGKIGYSLSDLETKYTCKKCNDTGFFEGKQCECLKKIMEV